MIVVSNIQKLLYNNDATSANKRYESKLYFFLFAWIKGVNIPLSSGNILC